MRAFYPVPLLLAGLLAGCAESPFVDTPVSQSVEKPADTAMESGTVAVCHKDSTPWAEIELLARESCAKYGFEATLQNRRRWDCRMTAPHRATFSCTLAGLVDETGAAINPSNKAAVDAWRKRTGKTLPTPVRPGNPAPAPATAAAVPASSPAAVPATASPAPAPAPATPQPVPQPMPAATPMRPLTPADIAGKPAMAPAPAPMMTSTPQAPATAAPTSGGFTLDSGSWGQHFEE
jgi:hypothetical protein